MKRTEIVIVGAGIAGISAAIYLQRVNVDFTILEGNSVGGKLNILNEIENFPAIKKIDGICFANKLLEQVKNLNIDIINCNVQTILKNQEGFEVKTDGDTYECKKVIIATGLTIKSNSIPGEQEYFGQGVSYCAVCDANFFKGQDVAVIGDSLTAIEEATYLSNIVNKVYLVSQRNFVNKINKNNIEVIEHASIEKIVGDNFGVTGIIINNKVINVAGVFPYIGKKSITQILNNLKPKMNGNFIAVDGSMMSNIDGLFAAGDIVDKPVRQLITAASDGAIAAVNACGINI